jgi:enamine deaminase RidA (YjgF/YER057c/UK114 family)
VINQLDYQRNLQPAKKTRLIKDFLAYISCLLNCKDSQGKREMTHPPARATIGVAALAKGAQVEIEVIASRG